MIERLSAHTLGDLQRLRELEVLCSKQQTTIRHLTERIASLEERLGKNSRNSSLPSSTNGPALKVPKRGRKRRRVGRDGRGGRSRDLLPASYDTVETSIGD